jgi:hypothetical protein
LDRRKENGDRGESLTETRQAASLRRRILFAGSAYYASHSLFARFGMRPGSFHRWFSPFLARSLFDGVEMLRLCGSVPCPGQIHAVATKVSERLPQHPRYRGYWYDKENHSLVGMFLGVDAIRHNGRYHIIECNLNAALRPERRAMYPEHIDPYITKLAELAAANGFERVVAYQQRWNAIAYEDFRRASERYGVEFVAASHPLYDRTARVPMIGLPEPLQPRTIYVVFAHQRTPLSHFLHNKAASAAWLPDAIASQLGPESLAAGIPSYDRPTLPDVPTAPNWPNLVIKLASGDEGKFVAMGRFATVEDAHRALHLRAIGDIPSVFKLGRLYRAASALTAEQKVIYQPFIPPEINNGFARTFRINVFISPLLNSYLSGHGIISCAAAPELLPFGLVQDIRPFLTSFSHDASYERPEPQVETELEKFARDFGIVANHAIKDRFECAAVPCDSQTEHHQKARNAK